MSEGKWTLLRGRARYALGLLCLLGVVALWSGSGFLMNYMFTHEAYFKPFFTTYLNTSAFSLYLVVIAFRWLRARATNIFRSRTPLTPPDTPDIEGQKTPTPLSTEVLIGRSEADDKSQLGTPAESFRSMEVETASPEPAKDGPALPPLSVRETAILSFQFCWLWFLANYASNLSYGLTNVASTTILSSMSGPLTMILATWIGVDSLTVGKLVAVVVSFVGVVFVGLFDEGSSTATNAVLGDVLALLGAVFYAIYITWLKIKIKHEDRLDMSLFFGFVGIFNIFLLLPFLWLVHVTGLEPFELPSGWLAGMLTINALFGTVMSDYLWLLAMLMTGPIVVTLGLSLTTPVTMVGEAVWRKKRFSAMYIVGAVLIIVGFFGANLEVGALEQRFRAWWQGLRAKWRRPRRSQSGESTPALSSTP